MKTLQILTITVLFTVLGFLAQATPNEVQKVKTSNDFKSIISTSVQNDFTRESNYLNENGITRLNDHVMIKFTVDSQKRLRVLNGKSDCCHSFDYVKQLIDKMPLEIDESMVGKYYSITVSLQYFAF